MTQNKEILAYPVGSIVNVSDISGYVTGICLRGNGHLTYEVSWWAAGQRYSSWLEEFEIVSDPQLKKPVGFWS